MMPTPAVSGIGHGPRAVTLLPLGTLLGFVLAVSAILIVAGVSFLSLQSRSRTVAQVTHAIEVLSQLKTVFSSMQDAETGQRGYLLTGAEPYLEPYSNAKAALPAELKGLRSLYAASPQQQREIDVLEALSAQKLAELGETIDLRRAGNADEALAVVRSDRGKLVMDRIRTAVGQLEQEERANLAERQAESQKAADFSMLFTLGSSALLLVLIAAAATMASRDYRAREAQIWLRTGQMRLSNRIQGEQRLDKLGDNILEFLADYLGAQVGAIYLAEGHSCFRRFAGYAVPPGSQAEELRSGDGLLGQAAKLDRSLHVREVPDGYFAVGSSLGRGTPRELLLAPASVDGVVQAVIELGFFRRLGEPDQELLSRVSEALGVAVRASKDRTRLEELLEETQRQAEELQTQQEELKVSNEELEEQGRALKQSQAQLESQQIELEQTNAQLEEQMQLLESQKDELDKAQDFLIEKANELERANQYKSEFLANMSHELRTPLNSTLILAKLLADNKGGNLNAEQVRYAQTILGAGNDLLALINDVLDLSKIEAGKVDVVAEPVELAATIDRLAKGFEPVALQKELSFRTTIEQDVPPQIETDAQQLGQILKNLLSNAFKFTEAGEVSLRIFCGAADSVSFAVRDTGIGIPKHQQTIIFEAFRQADGSTHRKYGGTGLGLSISRDLAVLLGGEISVQSRPGEGSEFTLTLPLIYSGKARFQEPPAHANDAAHTAETPPGSSVSGYTPAQSPVAAGVADLAPPAIEDDRGRLSPDSRLILIIEDDPAFAAILRDLARERGFQCLATHLADDGYAAALRYRPSAILLDMDLPDHSGLGVLDRLKHDPQTRHIPVHIVSVADHTHEALERGAVGYALKPVKREQLEEAFRRLEARFSQSLRRVLVVEDDERQRESIGQLLSNGEVLITGVANAEEALGRLQSTAYDCMVLDLNLPDLNGYELIKRMAEQDEVSFPPVIVYTGRSLSREEEQQLRRYSRSIIIKDARSPERLLDEVTLFIHQVESKLPVDRQRMLRDVRDRDATLEGRRILVVEDDVRNIFALSSVLEPKGAKVEIARNGRDAIAALERGVGRADGAIDLVLMDLMMPEMDGLTAMREIRKRPDWRKLPIIALTAKAMKDDREKSLAAGANDYIAKPLDVEKLLSLVRVWMPT